MVSRVPFPDGASLISSRESGAPLGRNAQISITVRQPYRLILFPGNEPIPRLPDGGLDWSGTTEVIVIEVVDYH